MERVNQNRLRWTYDYCGPGPVPIIYIKYMNEKGVIVSASPILVLSSLFLGAAMFCAVAPYTQYRLQLIIYYMNEDSIKVSI